MATVAQGCGGVTPGSIATHNRRTQQRLPIVDADNRAHFTAAGKRWRVVIGSAAIGYRTGTAARVIVGQQVSYCCRSLRIHREGDGGGWAGIPRCIGCSDAQRMAALTEFGAGEAPCTVAADSDTAEYGIAIADSDNRARFRGSAQHWRGVFGRAAVGDGLRSRAAVVNHAQATNGRWRHSIHGEIHRIGRWTGVTRRVGDGSGQAMLTLRQRWRGKAPAAIRANGHGAEQRGAIVNADNRARFSGAAQRWRVVIGNGTRANRALIWTNGVVNHQIRDGGWRRSVVFTGIGGIGWVGRIGRVGGIAAVVTVVGIGRRGITAATARTGKKRT